MHNAVQALKQMLGGRGGASDDDEDGESGAQPFRGARYR